MAFLISITLPSFTKPRVSTTKIARPVSSPPASKVLFLLPSPKEKIFFIDYTFSLMLKWVSTEATLFIFRVGSSLSYPLTLSPSPPLSFLPLCSPLSPLSPLCSLCSLLSSFLGAFSVGFQSVRRATLSTADLSLSAASLKMSLMMVLISVSLWFLPLLTLFSMRAAYWQVSSG